MLILQSNYYISKPVRKSECMIYELKSWYVYIYIDGLIIMSSKPCFVNLQVFISLVFIIRGGFVTVAIVKICLCVCL